MGFLAGENNPRVCALVAAVRWRVMGGGGEKGGRGLVMHLTGVRGTGAWWAGFQGIERRQPGASW